MEPNPTTEPEPQSEYQPLTHHRFFIGPNGLRVGWCILLFFGFEYIFGWVAHRILVYFHTIAFPQRDVPYIAEPGITFWMETASLLVALIAAGVMSRIERRPFTAYGFDSRRRMGDLAAGLATGLAALSLLVGVLWAGHLLVFDGILLHGAPAATFGLKWAMTFLVVGAYEEFLTRGYLQFTLARGISSLVRTFAPNSRRPDAIGFWITAICLSGLLFMALHLANGGETVVGITAVGVAGMVFAFSLWRTGALWWAIGFHAAWDWAQSYLYGVPDSGGMVAGHLLATHPMGPAWLSGGSDGPEGSIFVIPALLLGVLAVHLGLGLKRIDTLAFKEHGQEQ